MLWMVINILLIHLYFDIICVLYHTSHFNIANVISKSCLHFEYAGEESSGMGQQLRIELGNSRVDPNLYKKEKLKKSLSYFQELKVGMDLKYIWIYLNFPNFGHNRYLFKPHDKKKKRKSVHFHLYF